MKRPLLRLTLLYAGGLELADRVDLPLWPLLLLTLFVSALALLWDKPRSWLLPIAIVLLGASNFTQETTPYRLHDLRNLVPAASTEICLRGQLASTPLTRPPSKKSGRPRMSVEMEVTAVQVGENAWQPAWGRVLLSTFEEPSLQQGCVLEVKGVLQIPPSARAPGLFDYRQYLCRQGIYRIIHLNGSLDWRLVSPAPAISISDQFQDWAKRTLARGLPADDPAVPLLWAMTLGWRPGLNGEVSEPFMRSGTMHVFAISGLHILLITGILAGLLRFIRLPRPACALLLLPSLWFYAAVTGWQPSAVRSILMTSLVLGGWLIQRPGDLLNSLAAAALLLLLGQPQQLFQVGFQLSFLVVLSLILLDPVLEPVRRRIAQPESMLPRQLRSWWIRALDSTRRHVTMAIKTSLASWIGSLPVVAFYFHFFTPVSLLANLLVVPLSGLALASALGSLLTGGWLPQLSELFNHSAWFWMRAMMLSSQWSAALPGAWFHVALPGLSVIALYYAIVAGCVAGWFKRDRPRPWPWLLVGSLSIWTAIEWHRQYAATRLFILPVNGAAILYCQQPRWPTDLLIDAGSTDAVQYVVAPFLRAQGVNRLPLLALTHGDQQHISGTSLLTARIPIEQLCLGPTQFRSATYRSLHQLWQASGRLRTVQPAQSIGPWRVLHPAPADRFGRADDAALVLLGELSGTAVLFCSDLGRAGQSALLNRYPDLHADILITGLAGSDETLSPLFLEAIQPRLIVVADSLLPARERASQSLRKRLATQNVPVIYTHRTGTLTLTFNPKRPWQITTMDESDWEMEN